MKTRKLGQSGVQITPLLLGTSAIGGWNWGGSDLQRDTEAIQASLDNGVTTLDTAAIYGHGYCEELIGKVIKGRRSEVVIASKCGLRWEGSEGCDPRYQKDRHGNGLITRKNSKPRSIIFECEQSLKRLGVDYLDLYQIHWPDAATPIEESWNAMASLKEQGKVRAIGVSNYSLQQLCKAHAVHPVDCIQLPYSLVRRDIEDDILPFCIENHIGVLVYSPLERGLLSGKLPLERQFHPDDQRASMGIFSQEIRQQVLESFEALQPIKHKYGATYSQLVINAIMHTKGISGTIVGSRNGRQAIENAESGKFQLTEEEWHQIKDAFKNLVFTPK